MLRIQEGETDGLVWSVCVGGVGGMVAYTIYY